MSCTLWGSRPDPFVLNECFTRPAFVSRGTVALSMQRSLGVFAPLCYQPAPSLSVISRCACIQFWKSKLFRANSRQLRKSVPNSQIESDDVRALASPLVQIYPRSQVSDLVRDRVSLVCVSSNNSSSLSAAGSFHLPRRVLWWWKSVGNSLSGGYMPACLNRTKEAKDLASSLRTTVCMDRLCL